MALIDALARDLRHGLRILARSPGAALVTVLSLALGIATNTAVYTAYKAMVARPLDARDPARMVNIAVKREGAAPQASFSYPDYETLRESMRTLDGLVAYRPAQLTFSESGSPAKQNRRPPSSGALLGRALFRDAAVGSAEYASVFVVSSNYFQVLGAPMLQGRSFDSIGDAEVVRTGAVLISENYWRKRFAGDRAIVGRTIFLNGVPATIAGVTPRDFCGTGVGAPSFWAPAVLEPLFHSDGGWLGDRETPRYRLFGRLAARAGIEQVREEASAALDGLRSLHDPRSDAAKPAAALVWPGSPFPLPMREYRGLNLAVALVMAAAAMVLAVACANAASLQLARSRSRDDELRIRYSLGATRLRIVRQLAAESVCLGVIAGAAALPVTWALLKAAAAAFANAIPGEYGGLVFDVSPDLRVFAYVTAVSLIAGLVSGLGPAVESSGTALKTASSRSTAPARTRRMQDLLVAAQVSLALFLMVAAAMAIRSSLRAVAVDTGYETRQVVALAVQFPDTRSYDPGRKEAVTSELRARIETLPWVASVTSARMPGDAGPSVAAASLGSPGSPQVGRQAILRYTFVQPNYFDTLGIPLLLGRAFSSGDERTAVVSESAARTLWAGENPIGRTLRLGPTDERFRRLDQMRADGLAYQVVGVVRDTRAADFGSTVTARVYLRMARDRAAGYPMLIRTRSARPAETIRELDPVLTSVDPNLVATCSTLEDMLRETASFVVAGLAALVSSAIGLVGLALAIAGIYSTVSYIVVLRTPEVGIRMALGAKAPDILALILRESARPVAAGLAVGTIVAAFLAHFARGLLFGLDGVDLVSQAFVALGFLAIGLLASYPPARRAMRLDPMVALRRE